MATREALRRAQAKYQASEKQKKIRASRNKARRQMIREGKAHKGDGKDVEHKNGNPLDNRRSNLKVGSRSGNRSFPRTKNAGKKNPRD